MGRGPERSWSETSALAAIPSNLTSLAAVGDRLFFAAADGRHGAELWRSDGTRAGTVMVKNLKPGIGGSNPSSLIGVGSRLFFSVDDGIHGRELWTSDGTRTGTVLVKDISPIGGSIQDYAAFLKVGGRLFFTADDVTHGSELWRSGRHQDRHSPGERHPTRHQRQHLPLLFARPHPGRRRTVLHR